MLSVEPITGRTHQIRVHASHAGAPLLGDRDYGGPTRWTLKSGKSVTLDRIALHCARVTVEGIERDSVGDPGDAAGLVGGVRGGRGGLDGRVALTPGYGPTAHLAPLHTAVLPRHGSTRHVTVPPPHVGFGSFLPRGMHWHAAVEQ